MNTHRATISETSIDPPCLSPSTPIVRQHHQLIPSSIRSPSQSASLPVSHDSLTRSISSNQLDINQVPIIARHEAGRPSSPSRAPFRLPSRSLRSPNDLDSSPARSTSIESNQFPSPSSTTTTTESMDMVWISTMKKRHRLLGKFNSIHSHPTNDPHSSSSDQSNSNDLTPKSLTPASLTPFPPSRRSIHPSTPSPAPTPKVSIAPLVPPLGFAMVAPGVYRSGHPNHCNFAFLDGLQLKSIMYICADSYRPHTFNWAQDRGLKIFHHRIDSHKHPHNTAHEPTDQSMYASAIKQILDRRNLPILIHCNKGKHRVGTICALLRIIQGWDKSAVRIEWEKFLGEGAPPGKNMIWSPGLLINNGHILDHHLHQPPSFQLEPCLGAPNPGIPFATSLHHEASSPSPLLVASNSKNQKIKNKIADGLARVSEWEYVNEFPVELIQVDPDWIPSWLPIESIDR